MWDIADALKSGRLSQNTLDSQGSPVWTYRYKTGPQKQPIDDSADFKYMTYFDGPVRVYSEGRRLFGRAGLGGHIFLFIPKDHKDPSVLSFAPLPMTSPAQRSVAIGWHSPFTGTVDVAFDPRVGKSFIPNFHPKLTASLENSDHEKLWSKDYPSSDAPGPDSTGKVTAPFVTVPNVKVSTGESLYFVVEGSGDLWLTDLKLTVTSPVAATLPAPAVPSSKMNVVLILCDTLRRDHCSPYHGGLPLSECTGDGQLAWTIPTPNLERLALPRHRVRQLLVRLLPLHAGAARSLHGPA